MKKILFVILILIFSLNLGLAQKPELVLPPTQQPQQQKPLTQAEYVKMLYELPTKPDKKEALIEAIRTRGIAFELTDGLRGLTRTKGANDAELLRTLEEANRRRQNPIEAKLPTEKEAAEVLVKAREAALAAVEDMPDFVVKQQIQRSAAFAGTNNFRNLDKLVVAVSYRSTGQEEYKVLSVNGVLQENPTAKQDYTEVGGTNSTGEFVTVLKTIFKPENETKFQILDTDLLRGRRVLVFEYSITRDKAKQNITFAGSFSESTIAAMKGKIWIDRDNFRVLRVETSAPDIPETFPIRSATRAIDYDWVTIAGEKYLLPSLSDVRLVARENRQLYETRNLIRFKEYQKYGTEIIIGDEEEEVKDEKPD